MFNKLLNMFKKETTTKWEKVPTVDNRITDMMNKHTLYQWHGDTYMDIDGYTYEVRRKIYIEPKSLKNDEPILLTDEVIDG